MKLLWFSHFVPFPPRGGSFQRSFNLLRGVAGDFEVHLVAFNLGANPAERLRAYEEELRRYCAQVEFWNPPVRWRGVLWWLGLGASPFHSEPYSCRSLWSPDLAERLKGLLSQTAPALVHFDSIDLAMYFSSATACPRVLNHHNCESAMMMRRAETSSNPAARTYLRSQAHKLRAMEATWCGRLEANVAVSEEDARLLQSQAPGAHVHVVDNGTDCAYWTPDYAAEDPGTVVFAGSLRWYPNLSGMQWFLDRVWPVIKRDRPQARLCVAGREPTSAVLRWAEQDSSISVAANPEDIRPWIARGAVFVCPILDGGGTRLKILDALAMGKAVVTTTIGCEGLRVRPGETLLVADEPAEFAASALRLMNDEPLRRRLGRSGRALVEAEYDWPRQAEQLRQAYRCALDPQTCTLRSVPSLVRAGTPR